MVTVAGNPAATHSIYGLRFTIVDYAAYIDPSGHDFNPARPQNFLFEVGGGSGGGQDAAGPGGLLALLFAAAGQVQQNLPDLNLESFPLFGEGDRGPGDAGGRCGGRFGGRGGGSEATLPECAFADSIRLIKNRACQFACNNLLGCVRRCEILLGEDTLRCQLINL
jgi:hypothetical protein